MIVHFSSIPENTSNTFSFPNTKLHKANPPPTNAHVRSIPYKKNPIKWICVIVAEKLKNVVAKPKNNAGIFPNTVLLNKFSWTVNIIKINTIVATVLATSNCKNTPKFLQAHY